MKNALRLALIVVALAGCERDPLGFDYVDNYSLAMLQGGDGGVYFMPPLLHSSFSGEFAPDRNPVVVVCAGAPAGPCDSPVATLDMTLDAGEDDSEVLSVNLTSEKYVVNWKAADEARGVYRIFVLEDGEWLAFIDAALTKGRTSSNFNSRGVRVYGADATREFSGTLPIAFRMEVRQSPAPVNGLAAEYFDWSGLATPDFTAATPIVQRLDPVIDFSDPDGTGDAFGIGQSDHIMARWSGFMVAPADDFYTFCVTADDGVRFFINGYAFVDSWSDQMGETNCASFGMAAGGSYPIRLEWFRANAGPATMRITWQSPSLNEEVIPSSALWPN